ncbi:Translation initiation factor 3 subunit c [Tritrichomonas musculus]|uniref:Translation initiation factor 3 subunit c n=1 Tax=Tritrichomonas musculus TaxID=1915356 RepID=A0ABR2IKJ7_9EUKA
MNHNWDELLNLSDDEEEEDQHEETKNEDIQDEPQKVNKSQNRYFDSGSDNEEDEKTSKMTDKQKKFYDLRTSLGAVLDNIELKQYKKAQEEYTKLQNIYKRPPKIIKKNENPHFLIRELFEITQKVKELVKTEKDLRKFDQDIKKFNRNFEKELQECEEHPENFENDDDELENQDADDQVKNDDNKSDSESDGNGPWFYSSDDEDQAQNKDNQEKTDKKETQKKTSQPRKDMTAAEAAEARLRAEHNKMIDDETAKKELEEVSQSRSKGKVITTVKRLDDLYQAVMDKDLAYKIQLEICYTIEEQTEQAIPLENWILVLEFLPTMVEDAKNLVPLFERLNRDFWARSIQPRYLFTPDSAKLHEILPNFIKIMENYSRKLREQNEFALCTRLENMLIEHIYEKEDVDIMPHALSIFELLSGNIFDETITNRYRCKTALYLASNLAVRKHPLSAAEVFSRIPCLQSTQENITLQIISNRTSAKIGIAAFNQGYYKLSYLCLKKFNNIKFVDKFLGQEPPLYPPWLIIDKKIVLTMHLISAMLLDLPYLTTPIKDESKLLIKNKMHKDLEKENLTSFIEYQKLAMAINLAKIGEWKKSSDIVLKELTESFHSTEILLNDLKKISLCCFLLTANKYYESLKTDYLVKKFELKKELILEITKEMLNGFGPIEKAPIEFSTNISDDQNFLLFNNLNVESPFAKYGAVIQVKSQVMKESLNNLK